MSEIVKSCDSSMNDFTAWKVIWRAHQQFYRAQYVKEYLLDAQKKTTQYCAC